jgi:hypothetical protein
MKNLPAFGWLVVTAIITALVTYDITRFYSERWQPVAYWCGWQDGSQTSLGNELKIIQGTCDKFRQQAQQRGFIQP